MQPFIRPVAEPDLVDAGDVLDGWEVVAAPGHADGQLTLLRDGVLIAADHLLDPISPAVGLWPASRPDPLGDYLDSLRRTIELAPDDRATAVTASRSTDPVGRAHELIAHHARAPRLAAAALGPEPQIGVRRLVPALRRRSQARGPRRFAVAETLSHLERLVRRGARRAPRGHAERRRRRRLLYCGRSSGRASLQYRRPGGRGMTVVLELVGVAVSHPSERLLRRGRVLARDGATHAPAGAGRGGQPAPPARWCGSRATRRISSRRCSSASRSPRWPSAPSARRCSRTCSASSSAPFVAVLLAFLVITFLHVVVGELVPKGLALSYSERIALGVSVPVRAFFFVFAPLIWVLQRSSEARAAADRDRPATTPRARPTRRPS